MRPFSAVLPLLVAAALASSPALAEELAEDEPAAEPPEVPQVSQQPPPQPAPFLLVTVNVAGASIIVDDSEPIVAPAPALHIPPGAHVIVVSADGYNVSELSIQVPAEGARVDVFLDPSEALAERLAASEASYESSSGSGVQTKWWFWAAIGGGVIVVAGVIAAIALSGGGDDGQQVIPVPPIPGGP